MLSLLDRLSTTNPDNKKRIYADRMLTLVKSTLPELNVEFIGGKEWRYDTKTAQLTYVESDLETLTDRQIISYVLHEIGHALFTTLPSGQEFMKNLPEPKYRLDFFRLMNSVEDVRIEELMMQRYPGVFDNFLYKFRKKDSTISSKVEWELPAPAQYIYSLQRAFWGKDLLNIKPKVIEALEESEDPLFEAYQAKTTTGMFNILVDKLRPIYMKLIEDEDNDDKEDDEGEWEGDGSGGTPPSWLTEQQKQALKKLLEDKSMLDMGELDKKLAELSAEIPAWEGEWEKEDFWKDIDEELDNKEQKEGQWTRYGQTDPVSSSMINKGHEEPTLAKEDYMSYEAMYAEIVEVLPFFKKKIRSIMKDNNYNRQWGTYRTGKLNTKKLYRRKAGSEKVFSRKILRNHKDYLVCLLIDESGSMCSDEKNRNAAKATVLFSEVLHSAGIPFEIRSFNASHRCYKQSHETFTRKHRRQIERIILESHGRDAWHNNDGYAVNNAAYNLVKNGGKSEKILIVLSDGLPAPYYWEVPAYDKKRLPPEKHNVRDFDLSFEVAQASKHMTVIGVGIKAHHVQEYYQQNVLCDNVTELPKLVLNKLKSNIRRG